MRLTYFILILLSSLIVGCKSTYTPKLTSLEKQQKQLMLAGMPNVEFKQYIDLFFIKTCEDLDMYIIPRDIKLVSSINHVLTFELPSGALQEMTTTYLDCPSNVAL